MVCRFQNCLYLLLIVAIYCLTPAADELSEGSFNFNGSSIEYSIEPVATGLNFPWSVAMIDNDSFLVTERNGGLRFIHHGKMSAPAIGLPDIYAVSQGGLLDVVLHPNFSNNHQLFISYAYGDKKQNGTRLISAIIDITDPEHPVLNQIKELFTVSPLKNTPVHYGGRVVTLPDNTLLIATGDGFDFREQAQVLNNQMGKLIRLNLDGSVPNDNPFVNTKDANNAIFSYGHRNPQGLIYDAKRQQIYMHEHGPKGGDEINMIQPGKNYGWPIATFGKDYAGSQISPYTKYPGTEQPLLHWTPSIAPSGFAVYYGDQFKELSGNFLVGSLVEKEVRLVSLRGNNIVEQLSLFSELKQRIRDVRVGVDGAIYLLTDTSNGQLLKITRR